MVNSDEAAWELNEVGWWSNWADLTWIDENAYVITSREFGEYFFNRGGFIGVQPGVEKSVGPMESEFEKRGLAPHLFVQGGEGREGLIRTLSRSGYKIADWMSVMEMESPAFTTNANVRVEVAMDGLQEWAKAYLLSFYGKTTLLAEALNAARRAKERSEASLMLARLDGEAAGTMALYRTDSVCGAYCVGTRPEFRNRRVAATLLDHASRVARREGRDLVLQTVLSDSVEQLYLKLGFRRVYLKDLFVKEVVHP